MVNVVKLSALFTYLWSLWQTLFFSLQLQTTAKKSPLALDVLSRSAIALAADLVMMC